VSDDLQLLLEAARAAPPVPTADAAERLRRAVLVAGPLAGAGAVVLAKPAAVATRALLAKTLLGLAIIAVTGGAVWAVMHRAPPASATKVSTAPAVAVVPASITTEAAVPAEPPAPAGAVSRPLRTQRVAPPVAHATAETDDRASTPAGALAAPTVAPVASAPSIAAEIQALDKALAEVDAGRWAQALDLLARYRASFPQGALATEARTLEVLALCGHGRTDEAKALGRGLLDGAAASPTLMRLRHSCIAP
jgi:hypothetical protein